VWAQGTLVVDAAGCMRVKDPTYDPGYVPLWTPQYRVESEGDKIQILDGKGRVVGRVGEKISVAGSAIGRSDLEDRAASWRSGRCESSLSAVEGNSGWSRMEA